MTQFLGWASSAILILTLLRQVQTQWKTGAVKGVSIWLYLGQVVASTGFCLYSWRVHNVVFVATNLVGLASAIVGVAVFRHNQARCERAPA